MIANTIVYRKSDEGWATACFDYPVDVWESGEPMLEVVCKDLSTAMRYAVRAGGSITLVVEP